MPQASRSGPRYNAEPRRAVCGLLQGYACVREEAIGPAFATLANAIARHLR